jgi:L-amino acid N-acyltransferase YncA
MKLTFKELTEDKLPEILEIYNYYVLNTDVSFHVIALTLDEMRELVFFKDPKYKTYIAYSNDDLCGYGLIHQYKKRDAYDTTAEISLYLKPEYCGKGLGSKIISFLENFAREHSIHVMIAGIAGNNQNSIKLFEKNGYDRAAHFKEIGYKFGKFRDVYYYQKKL